MGDITPKSSMLQANLIDCIRIKKSNQVPLLMLQLLIKRFGLFYAGLDFFLFEAREIS